MPERGTERKREAERKSDEKLSKAAGPDANRAAWSGGLGLALVLFIACFCVLGLYARPSADDYNFVSGLRVGFWRFQKDMFLGWSGRCVSIFLASLAYLLDFGLSYPLLPSLNALLGVGAFYVLLSAATGRLSAGKKITAALALEAAWLASVPALNETFYWIGGMLYTWAAELSLLCLAGTIHLFRREGAGTWKIYLMCLCVFLNGMNLEQTSLTQIGLLFLLAVYFAAKKDFRSASSAGALFAAALGALLVMYLAPGTAARMTSGAGKDAVRTLGVAAVFGGITALKFFTKPIVYVFLLFLPVIAENVSSFNQEPSRKELSRKELNRKEFKQESFKLNLRAWHIFVLTALLAPFQQAAGGWAMGAGLPARSEGLAVWIMGAAWVCLWAFGYRNEAAFKRIRSLRLYKRREILLVLCLALSGNFISLLRDLPLASSYAAQIDGREADIARQKTAMQRTAMQSTAMPGRPGLDVTLPALTVKPRLLFFSDILPSPEDWKNQSFAEFHGLRSVSALPEKMLSDEEAVRGFQNGDLSALRTLAQDGGPEVQFMLGEIYDSTFAPFKGTPKDDAEAAKWYRMAVSDGSGHACRRLTRLYALGMGVPKNYFYAIGWLIRSQFW